MNNTMVNTGADVNSQERQLSATKRELLKKYLGRQPGNNRPAPVVISPRPAGEPAPLSFAQEQVWLHEQMTGDIPFYNETMTISRRGPLDVAVLKRCLLEIIRRHEIWRTTFEIADGRPVQIVHPVPHAFPLSTADLRNLPEAERKREAVRLATIDARRRFDLTTGPLLRALLVRVDDEQYSLFMTVHQIVFDAVTAYRVFLPELTTLYEAFSTGKPSPLSELRIQYGDFAYWQRKKFSATSDSEHIHYWREQLSGELAPLAWPDRARPPVATHRGAIERFSFPESLLRSLRILSQQNGVSFYVTLLTGFAALLHRYTDQESVVLGTFTAGRKLAEIEPLAGYFVNPLPLRVDVSGNPSFRELQSRVQAVVLDALAHEDAPFVKVVREIEHRPDPSRNPLFQVALSQQPRLGNILPDWELTTEEISNGGGKLDLLVVMDDRGDRLFGPITYNPDLFEPSTIKQMVGHWQTLLTNVSADPGQRIADVPILTDRERSRIVVEWNNTRVDYLNDVCLHELIEAQVERTPEATALVCDNVRMSYQQLNAHANQLAHRLRQLGVGPEVLVGICMERSIDMVVGLIGILKAGGAYLPLDVEYPKDRLRVILEDSGIPLLLTQQYLLNRLPQSAAKAICLDSDREDIARESSSNPCRVADPQNAAYAIYTSGSTGKPKGVLNIHSAIVNRLLWMQDAYQLTHEDRVLQKTPYSFDVSVWEFFWPLITGASLIIAKPGGHRDADYLVDLIGREKITTLHFVPSMLQVFLEVNRLEACSSVKRVICSGEALPPEVQKRFFSRLQAELHNLYGPTEAAVDVTSWKCQPAHDEASVPIGRPIANVQIYLLDRNLQPVPVGIPGELHIGGAALARGYLNRPELTTQKFIPDPFSTEPGARLYKTGDLARYRPDGNIEFLGRIDNQVKIRGFRIELGEIAAILHEHPQVRDARVIVREDAAGDRRLVAYIVPREPLTFALTPILDYLKDKLPGYMIPDLVPLERLPVTSNGKLDHRALPLPERTEAHEPPEGPRNAIEQQLAEVWTEVLRVEGISIYDNFFDLGGHSLSAIQAVARVEKRLGVRIEPKELAFQTLGQLAACCEERRGGTAS